MHVQIATDGTRRVPATLLLALQRLKCRRQEPEVGGLRGVWRTNQAIAGHERLLLAQYLLE